MSSTAQPTAPSTAPSQYINNMTDVLITQNVIDFFKTSTKHHTFLKKLAEFIIFLSIDDIKKLIHEFVLYIKACCAKFFSLHWFTFNKKIKPDRKSTRLNSSHSQ